MTNLYHHLLSNTLWGFVEAILWPITFPTSILRILDGAANYIKK